MEWNDLIARIEESNARHPRKTVYVAIDAEPDEHGSVPIYGIEDALVGAKEGEQVGLQVQYVDKDGYELESDENHILQRARKAPDHIVAQIAGGQP